MKVLGFKIYYADGTTFSSKQGSWEDAPSEGVQFVSVYFDHLREPGKNIRLIHSGGDYYWREETGNNPVFRMVYAGDPSIPTPREGILKLGKLISGEAWQNMLGRVDADENWEEA